LTRCAFSNYLEFGQIINRRSQVNSLIICGGMAFTFKKTVDGMSVGEIDPSLLHKTFTSITQIGSSLFDEAGSHKVKSLLEKAKEKNVKVVFPVDSITADKFNKDAKVRLMADRVFDLASWGLCVDG
jgi:phosphoglycerate kinase